MSAADFWNLAGRAGRWGKEFEGNIVCVDTDDRQRWPELPRRRVRQRLRRQTTDVLADPAELITYIKAGTPPEPPPASARPAKPALPDKPACLDTKEGCPGWEAYSYNDAIKAYNLQAQAFRPISEAYLQKLNAYVKASGEYAQCEVNAMQK